MPKPVQCIARNLIVLSTLSIGVACHEHPPAERQQNTTVASTQLSCDFDGADTATRQSQTAAIAVDLSGSMEATLAARCNTVGIIVTQLFDSLKERLDLDLFVVGTGKRAAPQVILDFTRVSTLFDVEGDDPLASLGAIEAKERELRQARKSQLRSCVVARCNRASTGANSRMLDLAESTLQHVSVRCKNDPLHCQKVAFFMVSDLADADIHTSNAASRIKNATLGLKSLTTTVCGTHQTLAADLKQQRRYERAWKQAFGAGLQLLATCPS